eukprot:1183813-Prorocentrum_minimum.AAC.3
MAGLRDARLSPGGRPRYKQTRKWSTEESNSRVIRRLNKVLTVNSTVEDVGPYHRSSAGNVPVTQPWYLCSCARALVRAYRSPPP